MKFLVFFILSPLFANTNALKCLVCDSIYESIDNVCRVKECDESAKEWLESGKENVRKSEELNNEDQVSLKAYYYNIIKTNKLENSLSKKEWRTIFDTCISKFGLRDGKPVKMKACGTKKSNACKNATDRDVFHSCSICETDYCNTLKCYSCGDTDADRFSDKFLLTPCKKNSIIQDFCYDDHMQCFSAIDVRSDKNMEFRGCISKNQTEIATAIFKKQSMEYYFCEGNLCNKEATKTGVKTSQNRNNSDKSKSRHKRSTEDNNISCITCQDVAIGAPCGTISCSQFFKENHIEASQKKQYCVLANGTLGGEKKKYKGCTYEGSGICNELKKKGYDSCSICKTSWCNALQCFKCKSEEIHEEILSPCEQLVMDEECRYESAQCFSANTVLNGKDVIWKGCIQKEDESKKVSKYFQEWNISYYFCDKYLCNEKNSDKTLLTKPPAQPARPAPPTSSNVTEPSEKKARSASQRLVLHFQATALVIIIMCLCLLF